MVGRGAARRAGRRAGRRAARRTTRRVIRRRRRRRIVVGGMVLLAAGGAAAAVKLTQRDAQRIEQHTGASVEELSDEELNTAMQDLSIQSTELTEQDRTALAQPSEAAAPAAASTAPSYIEELKQLGELRDQGILSEEEFEARKKQILDASM
jgi:hypothetical protein